MSNLKEEFAGSIGEYIVAKDGRFFVVCHYVTPENSLWGYQGTDYFSPSLKDFIKVTHPKRFKTKREAIAAAKSLSEGQNIRH